MAATRDFYESWESYSVGLLPETVWSQDSFRDMPQIVSSSTDGVKGPRTGSKMLRINRNATLGDVGARYESCRSPVVNYTHEIFYRFWIRPDENHGSDDTYGCKYLRFFINSGGSEWIDFFLTTRSLGGGYFNSGIMGDDQTTYWGDNPGDDAERTTDWSRVEVYINTTTGTYKTWNTGTARVLGQAPTGRNFGGLKATQIYLSSNDALSEPGSPFASAATNHFYIDDIEIFSDSGTGEATTGSMSDASIEVAGGGGGGQALLRLHNEGLFAGA